MYPDDPIAQLDCEYEAPRNQKQLQRLSAKNPPLIDDPVFGSSLDVAYRQYIIHCLSSSAADTATVLPLGKVPLRPLTHANRQAQVEAAMEQPEAAQLESAQSESVQIVLFNLLVALEWLPDRSFVRRLEWAFRRASDFLYDVTDGLMAFGQVVFAGADYMDCADIQIMVSNRFHPRSWVKGLHLPEKYLPIRLGRGLWSQRRKVSIPWDEPEAYRTIVHEWAHYALGLRDEYLERLPLVAANAVGLGQLLPQTLVQAQPGETATFYVAMQKTSQPGESIMGTLEGTSELVPHASGSIHDRKKREWQTITEHFNIQPPAEPLAGPGVLPLPLPSFHSLFTPVAESRPHKPIDANPKHVSSYFPPQLPLERCRIYVLRGLDTEQPLLLAQGTFEARSKEEGLQLLGALPGDTVVLVAETTDQNVVVVRGTITSQGEVSDWQNVTPATTPLIQVLPQQVDESEHLAWISVRITSSASQPADALWIFALGQAAAAIRLTPDSPNWESSAQWMPSLDGYVLLRQGSSLLIVPFTQGGGPPTHEPGAPVPITAGSADGSVMIFFYDERMEATPDIIPPDANAYSHVKVITTIDNSAKGTPPYPAAQALGYSFSLASNAALPLQFHPTLVIYAPLPAERLLLLGSPLICRLHEGVWQPLPTYRSVGASAVGTPLNPETAAGLFTSQPDVECYRLFWVPHVDPCPSQGS